MNTNFTIQIISIKHENITKTSTLKDMLNNIAFDDNLTTSPRTFIFKNEATPVRNGRMLRANGHSEAKQNKDF